MAIAAIRTISQTSNLSTEVAFWAEAIKSPAQSQIYYNIFWYSLTANAHQIWPDTVLLIMALTSSRWNHDNYDTRVKVGGSCYCVSGNQGTEHKASNAKIIAKLIFQMPRKELGPVHLKEHLFPRSKHANKNDKWERKWKQTKDKKSYTIRGQVAFLQNLANERDLHWLTLA